MPQTATVGLNFRLLPGDTTDTAVELVQGWLGRWVCRAGVAAHSISQIERQSRHTHLVLS